MALFNLFNSKQVVNSDVTPETDNNLQVVSDEKEAPVEEKKDEEKKIITITWGTGMPIDVIFNFIHKNFEEEGFQDALVNQDVAYRDIKEKITLRGSSYVTKMTSGKLRLRLIMPERHMLSLQLQGWTLLNRLMKSIFLRSRRCRICLQQKILR